MLGIVDVDCVCIGRTVMYLGLQGGSTSLVLKTDVDCLIVLTHCFDMITARMYM